VGSVLVDEGGVELPEYGRRVEYVAVVEEMIVVPGGGPVERKTSSDPTLVKNIYIRAVVASQFEKIHTRRKLKN